MKKLLAILLTLCMVLTMMPITASAESAVVTRGTCGDNLTWVLTEDGTLTISGTGPMDDYNNYANNENGQLAYVLPFDHLYDRLKVAVVEEGVTYIGDHAFLGATQLTSVTFPDSLTEIGDQVFSNCDKLTTINFGTGLTKTGIEVFSDCDALTAVTLPQCDVDYGRSFFTGCANLSSVAIPGTQTTLSETMFRYCKKLTQITLPNSLTKIGGGAFEGSGLTSIDIPDSVTVMGSGVFYNCDNLAQVEIPGSVAKISPEMFYSCDNLTTVIFHEGTTEMSQAILSACSKVTEMTIPSTVTTLINTFQGATGLKSVTFLGDAPEMSTQAFYGITVTAYYPEGNATWTEDKLQNYSGTVTWVPYHVEHTEHTYEAVFTLPTCQEGGYTTYTCTHCGDSYIADYTDPIDHIYEDGHCKWCNALEILASGTCGENLTWSLDVEGMLTISGQGTMKDYARAQNVPWYSYRSKIIRAWVQEGVTSLGNYAFYNLTDMFEITLPESLERIGAVALANTALSYVYIPSGVTEISDGALSCSNLRYISVSPANTAFSNDDKGVLFNKDKTILIRCPQTYAGAYAIPATVELVGVKAFAGCGALTAVTIPNSVELVDEHAFSSCEALTEVTIPSSVKELRRYAFASCDALETVYLHEGLEILDNEVFMLCHALKGPIVIPSTVTYFGGAFFDCPELTELRFVGDMPEFEEYAFGGISLTAYYPAGNTTWTEEKIEAVKGLSTFVPYDPMEEDVSGTWGDNITWVLTVDGTLIISGEGEAQSAWTNEYPWYPYAAQIRKVIFEEGVTNVPEMAFNYYYPGLVSAELKSVEVIGNSAFTQCYGLRTVTLPDTLKRIETSAFVYTALEAVQIPAGVTYIGSNAFMETDIQEIVLPEGLLELGDGVFWGCVELKSAYLPDSVTTIGMHLFAYCTALENANIPANLTTMPEAMFDGCTSLKTIEIPDGIENMYMSNFQGSGLVSVTIPASVKIMGSSFWGCKDLKEITFLGDAPEIMEYCFQDVVATAYYPAGNETWTADVMQNYGGNITWVPYSAGEQNYVRWYSGTTSLNGTIDLNIYVLLSKDLVDADDTYVRFIYDGQTVDVPMADAIYSPTDEYSNRYRFSCPIYAKQLADNVTVKFMKGTQQIGKDLNYSVVTYCVNQIKKVTNPQELALYKAMLNYGAASQQLFNHNVENLANASLSEADKVLPSVDASAYKYAISGKEDGIRAKSATLMLEDVVKVRVYFALTGDKTIEDYTFTIDGKVVAVQQNDKGYYVESNGIAAKDLEHMFSIQVGGITVEYGALSYVNSMANGTKELEANISKALFVYWQAAEALLS